MSAIGHNGGPTMEGGFAWRRHVWTKARAELLPKLPLEVARRRVKRAAELGLDYKSYAGIRASTGRDIIALLFSDNALRVTRDARLQPDVAGKLDSIVQADGLGLAHGPLSAANLLNCHDVIKRVGSAPGLWQGWAETRANVLDVTKPLPGDGVIVIGVTSFEKQWVDAGRLAGFIDADRYFQRG